MRTKRTIGIGLSSRESAKASFNECRKVFKKYGHRLVIEKNLDLEYLSGRKEFLQSDLIFVFGGDGSFLKVCQAITTSTPIVGIGCGERNFLMQIPGPYAAKGIQSILDEPLQSEPKTRIEINGQRIPVLNEIVVTPEHSATVMHYEVFVNQRRLWHDYADGVLIATPTGSSAYNAAAGGPRLLDHTHALVITSLNSIEKHRPVVVSEDAVIEIRKIHCQDSHIHMILDGQKRILVKDNEISIRKSRFPIRLLSTKTPPSASYSPALDKLAPSSRFIWTLIHQRGAITQGELAEATSFNLRTIRRAIKQLLDQQTITKRPFEKDRRQDLYHTL